MSRGWNKTDLYIGERVDLPDELYQDRTGKSRQYYSRFIEETETGLRFEIAFPDGMYKVFINKASVYCGNIKIKRADGTMLHVEHKRKQMKIDYDFEGRANYGKNYIK